MEIVDEGVKYIRTKAVKVDEEKEKIVEIEETEYIFEVDS